MSVSVSLSSAMRQNLMALQGTAAMQDTTQEMMATGKKVNSAIDNPNSYFTAQSLNNRASDLGSRMDAVGQALQTLKAASTAISALSTLVNSAKALATQAMDAAGTTSSSLSSQQAKGLRIGSVPSDNTAAAGADGTPALGGAGGAWVGLGNPPTGDFSVKVTGGITINVNLATDFVTSPTDPAGTAPHAIASVQDLVTDINDKLGKSSGITAIYSDGTINFAARPGTQIEINEGSGTAATTLFGSNTLGAANKFTVGAASAKSNVTSAFGVPAGGGTFTVDVANTNTGAKGQAKTITVAAGATIQDVVDSLNSVDSSLNASWDSATGKVQFKAPSGVKVTVNDDATGTAAAIFGAASVNDVATVAAHAADPTKKLASVTFGTSNSSATVAKALADFKTVMLQIDTTINDASYKGKNLLKGNDTMNVIFNEDGSSNLAVEGGNFAYKGDLKFADTAAIDWGQTASIQTSIDQANQATQILRDQSSKFGTAQSIIQTRQEFTNSMISTLKDGADRLTLADMNELAANSLALQTQRQLATNSLTMASQAAQSVLQMFR